MYLHYYLNQKYVGTVDIEVFLELKVRKTLITCSENCKDLLGGLELVYGRKIEQSSREEAYDILHGRPGRTFLPPHVFTTKKCGPILTWSDYDRTLACKL